MGKIQAFCDGIVTGLDPAGTYLGHKTGDEYFLGFVADKYSINQPQTVPLRFRPIFDGVKINQKEPESIDRLIIEQIFKGVGDSIGIVGNVMLCGLPQAALLLNAAQKHYQKLRIRYYMASE
ncbi:hypothetical protein GF323_05840 [Candidatus Woesearchaeota archaeon]|nr:hypothetical protein [Candidatus Woesearchaeota archaeon]